MDRGANRKGSIDPRNALKWKCATSSTKQTKHSSSVLTRRAALTKPLGTPEDEMKEARNDAKKRQTKRGLGLRIEKSGSI